MVRKECGWLVVLAVWSLTMAVAAVPSQDCYHVLRFLAGQSPGITAVERLAIDHKAKTKGLMHHAGPRVDEAAMSCPDGRSQCPQGQTCCQNEDGAYACCPYPKATCCSDNRHCCPDDYTCDLPSGRCQPKANSTPLIKKTPAFLRVDEGAVFCPGGGRSMCAKGQACCEAGGGAYACCPLPEAACCSDHKHCCPSGYACGAESGTCYQGNQASQPFSLMQTPAQSSRVDEGAVDCPGGRAQCANGWTCCETGGGAYACCPFPEAICCNDHTHCCPGGCTCNMEAGRCDKGPHYIPMLRKTPALHRWHPLN